MTEPTPPTSSPDKSNDGSAVWALVVGGAILAIAALLIFAQGGDTASSRGGPGGKGAGQQANLAADSSPVGQGLGVGNREVDPAEHRGSGRVTPGILPRQGGMSLAPPRPATPEPTSFSSVGAEIAYYEKKLEEARVNLEQRTLFRERMQRNIDNAPSAQARDAAEQRGKVVEENFNKAKQIHEDLVKKVAELKEKQRQTGQP